MRIALITGAAQGIGRAIAESLAEQGIGVAIADLDGDKADTVAHALRDAGFTAAAVRMDVTDPGSIEAGLDSVAGSLGRPTILINNAGVYCGGPTLDLSLETWRMQLDVNLTGPMLLAQATLPSMIDAGFGRIINMGSLLSDTAFGEDLAYCVAKTAVIGLTRSLAAEFAKHQVCVNAVCPGNIMTDLLKEGGRSFESRDGLAAGSWLEEQPNSIPLGRIGDPEDVAGLVRFLCSDDAGYITGQSIPINGGMYYR